MSYFKRHVISGWKKWTNKSKYYFIENIKLLGEAFLEKADFNANGLLERLLQRQMVPKEEVL